MRAALTAFGLLLVVGCGKREPPPSLPQAEARSAEPEEVAAPTKPTPAFVPSQQGSCTRGYRLVDSTCVHVHYRAGDESALRAALTDYQRGAAPPMLGVGATPRPPEAPKANKPDPGSLMRKRVAGDAGSAKDQRLAELDAMLTAARELLAKRDEQSKAKRVETAARGARADASTRAMEREPLDRFAQGMSGGSGSAGTGPGTSESERMSELSRVTSQLSGDQLKALTDELGKSGFNAGALESILSEAKGGQPQSMH